MTLYEPAFAVLHRELGKDAPPAIARVTLMGGLASTFFVPLTYWLVTTLGWRSAALVLALLVLLLCAPIFWKLPRQPQRSLPAAGFARAPLRAAMRQPAFWALLVTYAASALAFGAMTFHIIPLLLERGLTEAVAVALVTAIGPLQVAGRLGILLLWRDISARTLGRIITAGLPVSLLILIFTSGLTGALAFAMLYGVCNGLATILRGIAAAEFLGRDGFGAINGMLTTPASFAKAAAPALGGAIWVATGNYAALLWLLFAAATLAAIGFWIASASSADGSATERPENVRV
jgi:predicted MFS family arabinose efflux permease